jgi:hypothetical protein
MKKGSIISLNFSIIYHETSYKIIISSTNSRCVILQDDPILTPLKLQVVVASFINLLKPYTIKRKIKGDKRSPCHRPLSILNKGDVFPFIHIEKYT